MSNIALFSGSNVPAFAKKGELSDLAKSLAGGAGAGGRRVSIKGGVFRLLVAGKEVAAIDERYLDVVVVNAAPKIGRTFYAKQYDGETPAATDCWSADGEKPSPEASNPQSTHCANCPQNVKGSGMGESRACRYSQRLAVVLASDVEGDVMQLQLPATSIFGKEDGDKRPLQAYARYLAAQGVSPETLVTRMQFDTKAESPKLFFKPMRWLTEDEYEASVRQGQSDDAKRAITMTVAKMDNTPPAPPPAPLALEGEKPRGRGRPPKVDKPSGGAEAEPEESVEPTVRKGKDDAPPAAKPSLAALADQWDDE
jgi:hypothetical protein